jgi:ABC-type Zn uptake system ZnuABC Zn-binding protein ZnuA
MLLQLQTDCFYPVRVRSLAVRIRGPWLAAASLIALVAAGCAAEIGAPAEPTHAGLGIVTTVAPITSIVSAVAGDRATIDGIVPEGTNSHTFDPPPSVAKVLSQADVVFINGLKLEEPTKNLAEENKRPDARIIELGTTVLPESEYAYDFSFPREEGKPNPHLWTDPTWAIKYAGVVRDTLVDLDPTGADVFRANFAAFEKQATELSDALRADQESVPADRRMLLTYHDAYAYFAKTYGWTVVGAIQPENFEDPTPREVAALIDQIRAQQVPTVFGSEVFPSAALEEIGRSTAARYEDTLRDDDLPGEPGSPEHSWAGLMRYDYVTMLKGLGGTTPRLAAVDTTPVVPDRANYPQ